MDIKISHETEDYTIHVKFYISIHSVKLIIIYENNINNFADNKIKYILNPTTTQQVDILGFFLKQSLEPRTYICI